MRIKDSKGKILGSKLIENLVKNFVSNKIFLKINIMLEPHEEMILPTFSSKVIKTILEETSFFGEYKDYYNKKPKQMFLSLIRNDERKPLFKTRETLREPPLKMIPGKPYYTSVRAILYKDEDIHLFDKVSEDISFSMGKLTVNITSIKIENIHDALINENEYSSYLKIVFSTPTILTHKLEIPPWITNPKRIPEQHRLFPTAGILAAHMINMITEFQDKELTHIYKLPYYTLRSFNIGIIETDFNIKPVTVIYGKQNQKLLLPRGLTGWAIYHPITRWHKKIFYILMKIAEYTGIGRSRGIGFGEIQANPIRNSSGKQK